MASLLSTVWIVWTACTLKLSLESSIASHFTQPEFTNETKEVLRIFAPLQDLRQLRLCHVLPFSVVDRKLSQSIGDLQNIFKPGNKINVDSINDLKSDVYKVDNEAAYLKSSDMRAKINFYHENTNQRRHLEDEITKLHHLDDVKSTSYLDTVEKILNFFYNAPANLRVSSEPCLNDDLKNNFEDPNLRSYTASSRQSLDDAEITAHSRYLARKYNLGVDRDAKGAIRTTDKQKSQLNPELPQSLREYNKGLDVFNFFIKHKQNNVEGQTFDKMKNIK